ncbi:MAG: F0F1 ATP synthase subunit epsilon [Candidatus Latescibacteria bacterium]|nr:F0F1 ATP synthase subunit epsilon [bacterium]MCB9514224.1 F0F1 ATP synthase subunit epsilon [Candidatus Latescibacterota bacterium]MCB9515893.1 F0F1 ATP synthase subunit epsilon [Candidatus Latescibacterota bacterium]
MPSLHCKIVAPTGVVFEGEAASLKGPGWEGRFGILPRHAPYLVRLLEGPLLLANESKQPLYSADITGGFLLVARNQCTVLVEGIASGE